MSTNLNFVIDQVGKDKGIDRKVIIEALEQAVLTASRKKYGHQRLRSTTTKKSERWSYFNLSRLPKR